MTRKVRTKKKKREPQSAPIITRLSIALTYSWDECGLLVHKTSLHNCLNSINSINKVMERI